MLQKLANHPEVQQFGRFFVTGTLGFIIDASLTLFFVFLGAGPILARFISLPIAYAATWLINRYWTFASKRSEKKVAEFARYAGVQLSGAAVNMGCYTLLLINFEILRDFLIVPLAAGSIAGMFVTYIGSSFLVFRTPSDAGSPARPVNLPTGK